MARASAPGHGYLRAVVRVRPVPVLLLLSGVLVGWLLVTEALDVFPGGAVARPVAERAGHAPYDDALAADLERRARLRGLPGIERVERGTGRLVGTVVRIVNGEGERPVAGAAVEVLGSAAGDPIALSLRTDDEGRFAADHILAAPGYAVVVRHSPWREVVLRGLGVSRDRTTDVGRIRLGAAVRLRGEVVDAAGRPVSRAKVQVLPDRSRSDRIDLLRGLRELDQMAEPLGEAATARDGSFVVADVLPGRYVVRVSAPGFATAFRPGVWITPDEVAPCLCVVLDPGAGWTGRVTDADDRPVAGARVVAVAVAGKRAGGMERLETRSDEDGTYRLDSLIPGVTYFVEAWSAGFAPSGRLAPASGDPHLDFVLGASGRVEGMVTDATTNAPICDAEVALLAGAGDAISPLTSVTDTAGRYVFASVEPGIVLWFAVKAPGRPAWSFRAGTEHAYRVAAGQTTLIDAPLDGGVVAEGRVVDRRGRPVPWATVALADPKRRGEGEATSLSDGDGAWRVGGLRETTYEVHVEAEGFAPLVSDADSVLEVKGPGPVRRDLVLDAGGVLEGTVTDPDGAVVAGARIEAVGVGTAARRVRDLVGVSGVAGAWRIAGVPPNVEIRLEARHDLWAPARSAPIRLTPGASLRVDLALGEGARIEGRVVEAGGHAVAGARVRWGRVDPSESSRLRDAFRADSLLTARTVETDREGRFTVPRLEPGTFLLKVEKDGFAPDYRPDLEVGGEGETKVEIALVRSSTVSGRVRERGTGLPVRGAWVYAREADAPAGAEEPEGAHVRALSSVATREDGTYVLTGLPPGRYEVVLWFAAGYVAALEAPDDESLRRRDVEPGQTGIDFAPVPASMR